MPFTDNNVAIGQNMATESYNPQSPWYMADKTEVYYSEQCCYCNKWITCLDESEKDTFMYDHIRDKHPEFDPNNNGEWGTSGLENNTSGGIDGGSNENNGDSPWVSPEGQNNNKASLVYISDVARAMADLEMCSFDDFIMDYCWNGRQLGDNIATLSDMVYYIEKNYSYSPNVDLQTAQNQNCGFMLFARPNYGEYYNIITNACQIGSDTFIYDYFIVFYRRIYFNP